MFEKIRVHKILQKKLPWSVLLDYERSYSRPRVATGLACGSRKTKTMLDLRTAEQKQGSQKGFSANIFFFFFPRTPYTRKGVGGRHVVVKLLNQHLIFITIYLFIIL